MSRQAILRQTDAASKLESFLDSEVDNLSTNLFDQLEEVAESIDQIAHESEERANDQVEVLNSEIERLNARIEELEESK